MNKPTVEDYTYIIKTTHQLGFHVTATEDHITARKGGRCHFEGDVAAAKVWLAGQLNPQPDFFRAATIAAVVAIVFFTAGAVLDDKPSQILFGLPASLAMLFAYLNAAAYFRNRNQL